MPTRLRLFVCFAFALALPAAPLAAQPAGGAAEPLFGARDAWIAAGFVAGTAALFPLDAALAAHLQDSLPQRSRVLGGGAAAFRLLAHPGVLLVAGGLYTAGRLGDEPRLADAGLHTTEAVLVGLSATYLLKVLTGRARPQLDPTRPFDFRPGRGLGRDAYQSFPSGHTLVAFAAAAALTEEIAHSRPEAKWWAGGLLYGGAALAGTSRMYHNRHWASDVVMGAAIGSFSGWKVVRYNHTHPGNAADELLLHVAVAVSGGQMRLLAWPARERR